jgi:hypothetical protein
MTVHGQCAEFIVRFQVWNVFISNETVKAFDSLPRILEKHYIKSSVGIVYAHYSVKCLVDHVD